MKERPILFSGEMVRAILDGRKTQTRRVIKPQPVENSAYYGGFVLETKRKTSSIQSFNEGGYPDLCPYGQPGDRLWVRETWWFGDLIYGVTGNQVENVVLYKADGVRNPAVARWHPSIHMFREYSRINLEITNIRIERLNQINSNDAKAEGIQSFWNLSGAHCCGIPGVIQPKPNQMWTEVEAYKELWGSINGKDSWDKNPWVWVVEFRRAS